MRFTGDRNCGVGHNSEHDSKADNIGVGCASNVLYRMATNSAELRQGSNSANSSVKELMLLQTVNTDLYISETEPRRYRAASKLNELFPLLVSRPISRPSWATVPRLTCMHLTAPSGLSWCQCASCHQVSTAFRSLGLPETLFSGFEHPTWAVCFGKSTLTIKLFIVVPSGT